MTNGVGRPASHFAGLDDSWVLPVGAAAGALHRPSVTALGTVDGGEGAVIDERGLVVPAGRGFAIDWWVGADDRWHLPSREPSVRQRRIGAGPVVETRLRVPGGEALHRAFAVRLAPSDGGGDAVVIEVENRSAVPFALALAVRPFGVAGPGRVASMELAASVVTADGTAALVLPRPPNRAVASAGALGDVAPIVVGGAAEDATFPAVTCPDGLANAAVIVPVPHTSTFRAVIPLGDAPALRSFPQVLPPVDNVVDGWAAQRRQVARVVLPDADLHRCFEAAGGSLLLTATGPLPDATADDLAAVGRALELLGRGDDARRWLLHAVAGMEDDPALLRRAFDRDARVPRGALVALRGLAANLARSPDPDAARLVSDFAVSLVRLAASVLRKGDHAGRARLVLLDGATLLDLAGDAQAALDARALAQREAGDRQLDGAGSEASAALGRAVALSSRASATGTWTMPDGRPDHGAAARLVCDVADALLATTASAAGDLTISLAPHVPDAWLGQGFEALGLLTAAGRVSYAVRWHADRPALLWEIEAADGGAVVTAGLRSPGLDPAWASPEARGEALLAAVPIPEASPASAAAPGGAVIGGLTIGRRPPSPPGEVTR